MLPTITGISDIRAIEAAGLDAFLPHTSPYQLIRASAETHPHNTAFRYLHDARSSQGSIDISYRDFLSGVHQAANMFRRSGISADSAVAILAPNSPTAQPAPRLLLCLATTTRFPTGRTWSAASEMPAS